MRRSVFFCLAAALVFTGCVSTKTFKAATEESEMRRAQLEKTAGEFEALKAEKKILEERLQAGGEEAAALKARIDELTKEAEAMAASDAAKEEELATIKAELGAKSKENEFLGREVERLKLKAGELSSAKERELANVKSTYENLVEELKKEIEQGDIKITQAVDRLSVNMVEKILFDSGKAEIKKDGLKVIQRVGDILKKVTDRQIRVEGHTDNVQIGARIRDKYPTNWELSTARATNVVRYLQDKVGIDPKLLSAAGLADNKPVALNDTPEGKAQNRRIEVVLLPLDVDRVLEELKK